MTYKKWATNTVGYGSYSFCKTGSKGYVKFFTKSELKLMLLQHLGLVKGRPQQVEVVDQGGRIENYFMAEVKRLYPLGRGDEFRMSLTYGIPDNVRDEIFYYRSLGLNKVYELRGVDLDLMPTLKPVLEFILQECNGQAYLQDDMHNENFLLDKETNTVIPYDVFSFESMN